MEFTSGSSNTFDIKSNYETNIECGGKAAGKINNDFFSAKYNFNIDVQTLKISDIHFTDIIHIGETIIPENTSTHIEQANNAINKEKTDKSSSYSDIVDDTFEQSVYNILYHTILYFTYSFRLKMLIFNIPLP